MEPICYSISELLHKNNDLTTSESWLNIKQEPSNIKENPEFFKKELNSVEYKPIQKNEFQIIKVEPCDIEQFNNISPVDKGDVIGTVVTDVPSNDVSVDINKLDSDFINVSEGNFGTELRNTVDQTSYRCEIKAKRKTRQANKNKSDINLKSSRQSDKSTAQIRLNTNSQQQQSKNKVRNSNKEKAKKKTLRRTDRKEIKNNKECHQNYMDVLVKDKVQAEMKGDELKVSAEETVCTEGTMERKQRKRTYKKVNVSCHFCKKILSDETTLIDHIANWHTEEKRFKCDVCDKKFGTKIGLNKHMSIHSTKGSFICWRCGQVFSGIRWLNAHEDRQNCLKPVSCNDCELFFQNFKESHFQKASKSQFIKWHNCPYCSRYYIDACFLKSHKKFHIYMPNNACDKCGQHVDKPTLLIADGSKKINLKINFLCDYCGKGFHTNTGFKRHLPIHNHIHHLICHFDNCGLTFNCQYTYNKHKRSHTTEKQSPCDVCGKTFNSKNGLMTHLRRHFHTENNLIQRMSFKRTLLRCHICYKIFDSKNVLNDHMNSHTGNRPYPCTYPGCDKSFTSKTNVLKHEKRHSDKRRYICDTCGKAFNQGGHLKTHIRAHTGEKPYQCSICGRCFIEKTTRDRHEQKIHKKSVDKS